MNKLFVLLLLLAGFVSCQAQIQKHPTYVLTWGKDVPLTVGGFGLLGTSMLLHKSYQPLTEAELNLLDNTNVWAFDRSATLNYSTKAATASDIFMFAAIASPFLMYLDQPGREYFPETALMGVEVFTITSGLTMLTKELTARDRPYLYNGNADLNARLHEHSYSFFSGHTSISSSMAFYSAKLYNDLYPDSKGKPYVWASAALVPAITGFLRYKAGKHYWTDIIVGYMVGAAVGILVPELHKIN